MIEQGERGRGSWKTNRDGERIDVWWFDQGSKKANQFKCSVLPTNW